MSRFGSNYVFNNANDLGYESGNTATIKGVALKTILLLAITIITGLLSMSTINVDEIIATRTLKLGYFITPVITLVLSLIMSFKPNSAKILAIPYAIFEGFGIGSIGILLIASLGKAEAGLILGLALLITVSIFMGASVLYTSGKIQITTRFRRIMYVILLGIVLSSSIIGIISIFNPNIYPLFFGNSSLALLISIIMIIVASIYSVISLDSAHNIVKAGLAKKCEVQIAYAIGIARPVSVMIDTFGTAVCDEEKISLAVNQLVDLRPAAIIKKFDLRKPIYKELAAYGHMGREELCVKWEECDIADKLRELCL